jgi:hypothetical protein
MIDTTDEDSAGPDVAADPSGGAVAVWFQREGSIQRIVANWYVPEQGWQSAEVISPAAANSTGPKVGVDLGGHAIAVWRQHHPTMIDIRPWASHYTPSVGWAAAEAIGAVGATIADLDVAVAVAPGSDAMSVWHQRDGDRADVWANHYTSGGAWGTAGLIEAEDGGSARNPVVTVDGNGNAIAVWQQNDGMDNFIASNRSTPSGVWGAAGSIDNGPGVSSNPRVSSDPLGNAMAVWTGGGVKANRYAMSGGWGAAEDIRQTLGNLQSETDVGVSADGTTIAVWGQFDAMMPNVWANRYVPGDGWGTALRIGPDPAGNSRAHRVAVDANGNAVAVWQQSDGTRSNIWANQYVAGAGWATAELIESEDLGDAQRPRIAVDPDGNAIAVWYQDDGTRVNAWANRLE